MKKTFILFLAISALSQAEDNKGLFHFSSEQFKESAQQLGNLGKDLIKDSINHPQIQAGLQEGMKQLGELGEQVLNNQSLQKLAELALKDKRQFEEAQSALATLAKLAKNQELNWNNASEPVQILAGIGLANQQEVEQATQALKKLVELNIIDENKLKAVGQFGEYLDQFKPSSGNKAENNFHPVSKTLFRSEQLTQEDLPLLRQHQIRTLVNLRFFNRGEDKAQFTDSDLTLINIPMVTWSIEPQQIAQALFAIEQGEKQGGVLVHCYHGSDRTGLVVGMYRIIMQNWSIADAEKELREGGYGYHAIWQNIRHYFDDEGVNAVRRELEKLRAANRVQIDNISSDIKLR